MKVTTLKKEIPVKELAERFMDVERISECCEKCPGYGKKWACPPLGFDPMEFIFEYDSILVAVMRAELSDDRLFSSHEELEAAWRELLAPVKAKLADELFALERAYPNSLALLSGGCDGCAVCAREKGMPCVRPEVCRYSPEALGCDVLALLDELFGEKAEWAEAGRLPKKYLLLGGLLKKA